MRKAHADSRTQTAGIVAVPGNLKYRKSRKHLKISLFKNKNKEISGSMTKIKYRCADKSLARPGRKQANVSVRMA